MTTTIDPINILMTSDLHFGIPSVSQSEMAIAFSQTVFPLLEDNIDLCFINGDFFDTLVPFDNHQFDAIFDVIVNLFQICERKRIILRILQGTWMHDRNQLNRFETFYRNGGYGGYTFDFKVVHDITLEEIFVRGRDLRIMYVQDDLRGFKTSDDVVVAIKEKMVDVGWDHVDYGCMHGFFDFTFPKGISQEGTIVYREDQFPFVTKMIDVGHVHQHRSEGKVISNGSFDRAVFGDEDPKGLIKILDYPDHYTAHFIENKLAAVYDTLAFTKDDTTETIAARITRHIAGLNTSRKVSLRFIVDLVEHREAIKTWMRDAFPEVRFTFKKSSETKDKTFALTGSTLIAPVEKRIAPTRATIATFIRNYIPEDYVLSVEEIEHRLEPVTDKN